MKLKAIRASVLNSQKKIRYQLFAFWRNTKFDSEYIEMFTKVYILDKPVNDDLGNKVVINLKNFVEKESYVNHVLSQFSKVANKYSEIDVERNYRLGIYYLESNSMNYNKYILKLRDSKNFDF